MSLKNIIISNHLLYIHINMTFMNKMYCYRGVGPRVQQLPNKNSRGYLLRGVRGE